jgi:hypothetical protein
MSIGPLISLAGGYLESLFANSLSGATSGGNQDTNRLSPFAQVLSSLQQLQQSNPSHYQQVTQQISSSLHTAAQSATASGNTSLANELNKLSTGFSSASTSGRLPNVPDLAQAVGRGYHHLSIVDTTLSKAGFQTT